ncbi:hypothetical protein JTB14_025637 [Gonioctena quinquepunctata]|nr:hypothetical protein JTB14_025637 [Gonioctena quinquepunctata]
MERFLIKKVGSDASLMRVDKDVCNNDEANSVPQTENIEVVAGSSKDKSYNMNIEENKTSKKKKTYKQKFRSDWKSKFKWAEPYGTGTSTKCIVCNIRIIDNYLPLEELYCGAKAKVFINETNIDKAEVNNFRIRVLDYYVELARQIKKRFDFNNKVLLFAQNFDPKAVMTDIEKLDFEYRLLSETNELKKCCDDDITEFWYNVSSLKNSMNEDIFENVFKLSKIIMCLPHSSAAAERIFSQLNLVKTRVC